MTDYWVQLRYRVTYAKVLDANRKFLEAAMRYYELSQAQRREIPQVGSNAITCTHARGVVGRSIRLIGCCD